MHDKMHGMMHMKKTGWGWQNNWKSPISLGFFLLAAALALAIFLYTILNLVGTILEATHPAASQDGMSAQELQQLEQSAPASDGSTAMPATTGAAAQ